MKIKRGHLLKRWREGRSKAELYHELATPANDDELRRVLAGLPEQRLCWIDRIALAIIVPAWLFVALTEIVDWLVTNPMAIRGAGVSLISVLFLYHVSRLNGIAYGWGILWLVLAFGSLKEVSILTIDEREDPYVMGAVVGILALIVVAVLGMAYLKLRLGGCRSPRLGPFSASCQRRRSLLIS
ncbi:MAG: hypothetical protein ACREM1_23920 [Longimicrobiales bacterium]